MTADLTSGSCEAPEGGCGGLLYHAGALGDFVLSLPAIYRAVQARPGTTWSLWGSSERLTLLPGFRPAPATLVRRGHSLWGAAPSREAIDELGRFRTILAFGGASPPRWYAPSGPLLVRVASFPSTDGTWVPAHQAAQLDVQGVPAFKAPWLPDWRRRVLPEREPAEVLLHPGSGDRKKNAPVPLWGRILDGLRREVPWPFRLVLGPTEAERGGWQELASRVDQVLPCNSIADLLRVLSRAVLYMGNDAGASHLAAALGVPTVVLFGPSDPRLWRPLGSAVRVFEVPRWDALHPGESRASAGEVLWEAIAPEEVVHGALDLVSSPWAAPQGTSSI